LRNAGASVATVAQGVAGVSQVQWVGAGPEAIAKGFKLSLAYQGKVYTTGVISGGASESAIQSAVNQGFAPSQG